MRYHQNANNSHLDRTQKNRYLFSAKPDKVTCTVTANDNLKSVHYDDEEMDLVGDREKWQELKTFEFESKDSSNGGPGELKVVVEDKQDDGERCVRGSAGFLLRCEAKNGAGEIGLVTMTVVQIFLAV